MHSPTRKRRRTLFACCSLLALAMTSIVGVSSASAEGDSPAAKPTTRNVGVEALLEKYKQTGKVDGAGSASDWTDFSSETPQLVLKLANALWAQYNQTEGYGPVEWIPETKQALLWWNGDVPTDVTRQVAATSAASGVKINLSPMKYSGLQLSATAKTLADKLMSTTDVSSATALYDGSGIEIALTAPRAGLSKDASTTSDQLGALLSFPVTYVVSGPVATSQDRSNQNAPYAGGGRIQNFEGQGCTSGFSVMIGNPAEDVPADDGMMFAHHCGGYGPGVWGTEYDFFFGFKSSQYVASNVDVAVMTNDEVKSGYPSNMNLYYPMMYLGTNNAADRWVVVDGQAPVIGADWCVSGGYSGTFCYNNIEQVNVYVNYQNGGPNSVGPLVETQNTANLRPVGQGDSGGPGFNFESPDTNGVYATGIISGMRNASSNCSGIQQQGRQCSDIALISPIYPAMSQVNRGLRLMTVYDY